MIVHIEDDHSLEDWYVGLCKLRMAPEDCHVGLCV